MMTADAQALQCSTISLEGLRVQYMEDKETLAKISEMMRKPILCYRTRQGVMYAVLDGNIAYVYRADRLSK